MALSLNQLKTDHQTDPFPQTAANCPISKSIKKEKQRKKVYLLKIFPNEHVVLIPDSQNQFQG